MTGILPLCTEMTRNVLSRDAMSRLLQPIPVALRSSFEGEVDMRGGLPAGIDVDTVGQQR